MKLKFWQWEFEFDKDDARVVIPLILLLLALTFISTHKGWLIAAAAVYYFSFFFLYKWLASLKNWLEMKVTYRCPYCKSREVIFLGIENFRGDVPYDWYRCNTCREESVYANKRLIKVNPN